MEPGNVKVPHFYMPDACKGIFSTLREVVFCVPMRYEDRRQTIVASEAVENELAHIAGVIESIEEKPGRGNRSMWTAHCKDTENAPFRASFFVMSPYHKQLLKVGAHFVFQGKPKWFHGFCYLSQPALLSSQDMGRLVPVYRKISKFGSMRIWQAVQSVTRTVTREQLYSLFPTELQRLPFAFELPGLWDAFHKMHTPSDLDAVADAVDTLRVFELGESIIAQKINAIPTAHGDQAVLTDARATHLRSIFPFTLSPSQDAAERSVRQALASTTPANILIQGGVGSGKSAVAYLAALTQAKGGIDGKNVAVLVAPTTILADQLQARLQEMTHGLDILVMRGQSGKKFVWPERGVVVGTHGMVGPNTPWERVGLVVFDEEHRFGAETKNIPASVNRILMSATPIPATIAAIRFGGMQILRLESNPMGRQVTCFALEKSRSREAVNAVRETVDAGGKVILVYGSIAREALAPLGECVFIQSPEFGEDMVVRVDSPMDHNQALVAAHNFPEAARIRYLRLNKAFKPAKWWANRAPGDMFGFPVWAMDSTQNNRLFALEQHHFIHMKDGKAAVRSTDQILRICRSGVVDSIPLFRESQIRRGVDLEKAMPYWQTGFKDKVGVLHGQLSEMEKQTILNRFTSGECPVLLSTTIVEVGVDIDGVDTIVVANADRMGVASLVQLRGRVGRQGQPGRCFFIGDNDADSQDRLNRIARETDDERLAEMDFMERGFGSVKEDIQSGHALRIFQLPRDYEWLQRVVPLLEHAEGALH
ncbi:DEAD/DEAH box helicase [Acidithiobacillus ferrivorans]|nr:DEAD/DEAH box helicase [Acidithiobacillus ferrivorans]